MTLTTPGEGYSWRARHNPAAKLEATPPAVLDRSSHTDGTHTDLNNIWCIFIEKNPEHQQKLVTGHEQRVGQPPTTPTKPNPERGGDIGKST